MDTLQERAREVGRLVAQTDEYQSIKKANQRLEEDRESVTLMNRLNDLEGQITAHLQSGNHPPEEIQEEYGQLAESLQQRTAYQTMVAAQANFERLMARVNEDIARGIQAGEQSRIILP